MSNTVLILPAADIMIDLGFGITLTHIRRSTGSVFHLIIADVLTNELNRPLPVTFNVDDDNTILHTWYRLDDDSEREYIREAVRQFIHSCVA